MSHWRDRMGPASFRGVPFYVETAELAGGRRRARHEYPLRDVAYSEDMGRKGREFPVEGHVVGEDYLAARDSLLAALEQAGPGELVHPYYGARTVCVEAFRVRETSAEGGMATFSITFEETEAAPQFPASVHAASERVASSADAVLAAMAVRAEAAGSTSLPASAIVSLSAVVTSGTAAMEAALAPVIAVADELAAFKALLAELDLDVAVLVRTPGDALARFLEVFDSFPTLAGRSAIDALLDAYAFVPTVARPPATTTTREEEQVYYDLLLWLIRLALLMHCAKLAAAATFVSYDDAVRVRDEIADALDAESESADDDTYALIDQLRADLVRAVPGEDSDLPRIVRYTPDCTLPSLVLAHRLYGNLDREADLVTRNAIVRPGFIRGGSELEVLSDE